MVAYLDFFTLSWIACLFPSDMRTACKVRFYRWLWGVKNCFWISWI